MMNSVAQTPAAVMKSALVFAQYDISDAAASFIKLVLKYQHYDSHFIANWLIHF